MDIIVSVAMRQQDGSADLQKFSFTSTDDAGGFISEIFKQLGDTAAVAIEVDAQPVHWHRDGENLVIDGPLEDDEIQTGEMNFQCEACERMFGTPLYGIDREYARTEFPEGGRHPVVDIKSAETIANFCSSACRDREKAKVFEKLSASITLPGIGPIETCSRCSQDIDMSQWHVGIAESTTDMDTMTVREFEYLAVLCPRCVDELKG